MQPRGKRLKYIEKACAECRQRKVKCSGGPSCAQCRSRGVVGVCDSQFGSSLPAQRTVHIEPGLASHSTARPHVALESSLVNAQLESSSNNEHFNASSMSAQMPSVEVDAGNGCSVLSKPAGTKAITGAVPLGLTTPWSLPFNSNVERTSPGLALQLASVQRVLGVLPDPSPLPDFPLAPAEEFMLELKPISELNRLVTIYFREASGLFPILEEMDLVDRIFKLLESHRNSEVAYMLPVNLESYPAMALLCNLLAIAQLFSYRSESQQKPHAGWTWYLQAQNMHHHFSQLDTSNLDVLKSHVLGAYYLMMCGLFSKAFRAVNLAIGLAMELQLNIQDTWLPHHQDEILRRKRLWWGLYVLDQKISQHCGLAYSIREHEIRVDDLLKPAGGSEISNGTDRYSSDVQKELEFFEALVSLSRTSRTIWDCFFSATGPRAAEHVDTACLDSQILHCASDQARSLTWQSERPQEYLVQGESGMSLCQRMIIFNEITLLRLLIRQHAPKSAATYDSILVCSHLIKKNIREIAAMVQTSASHLLASLSMSTCLVTLAWRLLSLLDQDQISQTDLEASEHFRIVCQTLEILSQSHNSARQSLAALRISVSKGNGDANVFERMLNSTQKAQLHPVIQPISLQGNDNSQDTLPNPPIIEKDVLQVDSDSDRSSNHKNSCGEKNARQSSVWRRDLDQSGTGESQATSRSLLVDELDNVYGDLDF